jgi:hypothetical protein
MQQKQSVTYQKTSNTRKCLPSQNIIRDFNVSMEHIHIPRYVFSMEEMSNQSSPRGHGPWLSGDTGDAFNLDLHMGGRGLTYFLRTTGTMHNVLLECVALLNYSSCLTDAD